jgi:glucoamylase
LASNFKMDWEFDGAPDGNIALTGELDLTGTRELTLGWHSAIASTTPSQRSFNR